MSENETRIDNLSGGISDEDAKLVDSILNDLGQGQGQGQGQGPQMSPEQQQAMQQQAMLAQQQQQLQQQQAMQQQAMQQQQQQGGPAMQPQMSGPSVSASIMEEIQAEAKSIIVIMTLFILLNLDQVNDLFKKIALFVSENGSLNMQSVFVKALLLGSLYFVIKTKLL